MPTLYELCCCIESRARRDNLTPTSDANEVPAMPAPPTARPGPSAANPIDIQVHLPDANSEDAGPIPKYFAYSAESTDSNSTLEYTSSDLQLCSDSMVECCICFDYIGFDDASTIADGQFECGHGRYMHSHCLDAWAQYSVTRIGVTPDSATCPICRAQVTPSPMSLGFPEP